MDMEFSNSESTSPDVSHEARLQASTKRVVIDPLHEIINPVGQAEVNIADIRQISPNAPSESERTVKPFEKHDSRFESTQPRKSSNKMMLITVTISALALAALISVYVLIR